MSKKKILSVDDEPTNQLVIQELLEDDYEVKLVYSGEECLSVVNEFSPDLILLDINMPGINGYETCEALKSDTNLVTIPVIILSALSTTEEKLKGYEVGAEDYIPKPFDHDELISKICKTLEKIGHNVDVVPVELTSKLDDAEAEELLTELQNSRVIAMDAMRYTGDLGTIVKFYEESSDCKDFESLAKTVFKATSALGLTASLQIRDGIDTFNASSSGEMSAMEVSVIDVSKDKGRFFDFKARTIMNYSNTSILIKNMPLDDDKKYGIMKDILGALGNGSDERVRTILLERLVNSNREQVISLIKETFRNINIQYSDRTLESNKFLESLITDVNDTIQSMDLLSYQEEQLEKVMEEFRAKNEMHLNAGMDLADASVAALESINGIFETLNAK